MPRKPVRVNGFRADRGGLTGEKGHWSRVAVVMGKDAFKDLQTFKVAILDRMKSVRPVKGHKQRLQRVQRGYFEGPGKRLFLVTVMIDAVSKIKAPMT